MNYMNKINDLKLAEIEAGRSVRITKIDDGGAFKEKLISMGLLPGREVEVISARGRGPVVIKVNETRLALGHGMAQKIYVRLDPDL